MEVQGIGGIIMLEGNRNTRGWGGGGLVPVPLCLPQIPREVEATLTALFVGS